MSTTVIRDLYERPIAPRAIVEALQRVDDRLNLRYIVMKRLDYANLNLDEKWAITMKWTQDDPRRIMIQRGQMADDADFDVLTYLPLDCDIEQAETYFRNAVRGQVKDRRDLERMVSRVGEWNAKVTEDVKKEEIAKAEEVIDANKNTLFEKEKGKVTQVYMKDVRK